MRRNQFLNFKYDPKNPDIAAEVAQHPPQQPFSSPYLGSNEQHQEFQENVMHILDRSHQRYRMKIDNSFIVDSERAKELQQAVSRNSSTSDRDDASNTS